MNCQIVVPKYTNAPDQRNAYLATDVYRYIRDNETFIQSLKPVTDIGILYSKPTGDHLLTNAVNYLFGQAAVLKTNAPASVHVYLNKADVGRNTFQLSLVNTSSSSQRSFRDLIPVQDILVELLNCLLK